MYWAKNLCPNLTFTVENKIGNSNKKRIVTLGYSRKKLKKGGGGCGRGFSRCIEETACENSKSQIKEI